MFARGSKLAWRLHMELTRYLLNPPIRSAERSVMNWDQLEGKWMQLKGKAREEWAKLTDQDVEDIKGKRDNLIGRLTERYGYEKEKASQAVDEWIEKIRTN